MRLCLLGPILEVNRQFSVKKNILSVVNGLLAHHQAEVHHQPEVSSLCDKFLKLIGLQ